MGESGDEANTRRDSSMNSSSWSLAPLQSMDRVASISRWYRLFPRPAEGKAGHMVAWCTKRGSASTLRSGFAMSWVDLSVGKHKGLLSLP